ncbi:hypothetical protein BU24DRAFT_160350 [Aaosphaeria arxii CBS 175.79]|uniref:AA1-like domain-containing protein n=1 Tax=Aaosphaeria arxii CBS 175.79 TaxID=1450172 RepID=A0A6A5XYP9_9PLEO|nr:uncharacterized protein BU24DRAFT_160350 [Aaosphaeria arxii CBS 175.79]KAF2017831.1 hypothetical protein BU24DRAFT_160350 [Aaosphaeria arxii CBS 175.79]
MLSPILPLLLSTLPLLTTATPLLTRQSDTPSLTITNFIAFHADPYIEGAQSNLSFHVSDTRPGALGIEVDCAVPPTYFNLYAISALFDNCGDMARDVWYRYSETGLTVRRGWWVNETAYVRGTATQSLAGINPTTLADGKLWRKEEAWAFPMTVRASNPP